MTSAQPLTKSKKGGRTFQHFGQGNAIFRRARTVARPRQIAMYLAKQLTSRSLPEIGRKFDRDHTTVMHAVRKVEELILEDASLAENVDALRRILEA